MGLENLIDKYGSVGLDQKNWFSVRKPEEDTSTEELGSNGDIGIALPEEQKDRQGLYNDREVG